MISERKLFIFDDFVFDAGEKVLRRASGETVPLAPRSSDLLAFFIENTGRLLTKDELLKNVWQDAFVEESNLTHHIARLRSALGEDKNGRRFIETLPRKGYRFVAPVVPQEQFELVVTEKTATRVIEEEIEAYNKTLIGRGREVAVIKNLLRRADLKILTLTGVGGTGKTSVAKALAAEMAAEFAGGARFVDLSSVRDSGHVAGAIAQALKIQTAGADDGLEAIRNHLRERETLLVLDNFEQVLDAAPQIARIAVGSSKILVTSRARLQLNCEREFLISPLALPGSETLPEELIGYAAIELFVERARAVKPKFELTDENAPTVAEICRRLEGLPLAIELAAARLRILSPAALLERLSGQLNFLTGGARDLPARQQTMRAAIAWSYDLLDEAEKRAFRALSVFAGGVSLQAAEFVVSATANPAENHPSREKVDASSSSSPPIDALDIIEALADKNLLQTVPDGDYSAGETRFRLLEPVREFALEKLAARGAVESFRQRHADFFCAVAARCEAHRRARLDHSDWTRELEIEIDNLRAALNFLLASDPEKALRLAADLHVFWSISCQLDEGRKLLDAALGGSSDAPSYFRGVAYKGAGILAWKQGDYEAAMDFYQKSLQIGEKIGDKLLRAMALNGLGTVAYLQNDVRSAKRSFEDALALSRQIGGENLIHTVLTGLGEIARLEEDYAATRAYNTEVAEFARRNGDKNHLCGSLLNLGAAAVAENDLDAAQAFYEEAARLAGEINSKGLLSVCFDGFAAVAARRREIERALEFASRADELRRRVGYTLELPDRIFRDNYLASLESPAGHKNTEP